MSAIGELAAVVTHHQDGSRSGVARFNAVLAERIGVPLLGLAEAAGSAPAGSLLLSFKFSELPPEAEGQVAQIAQRGPFQLFLHDFAGGALETDLIARAELVWCANHEVLAASAQINPAVGEAWAPSLLDDKRRYRPADLTVFSFGMAHKVRTQEFARLKQLLDESGKSYVVYMSHANHETATLDQTRLVHDEMQSIFGDVLYFLGNLSDVAIYNYLVQCDFFAAFFPKGARANNTTIATAMEHGAVVVTNLDEHSPEHLEHMRNVVDIRRCQSLPSDPLELRRLEANAMETARRYGWDELVHALRAATFSPAVR